MRGVGMRRCALTPCPAPAHGSGETGIARGSIPRAGVRAGERFALKPLACGGPGVRRGIKKTTAQALYL
ncbi:MAG: hypothetical protein KatS3mg058_0548 [Roseiflexus sp.]|nr:MAG: hypothetical protein KatS3mg058_0548 [Roseiflexus sp.]